VGHALRSSGLLCVKASLTRVSQSGLRLTEARRRVVHVALSRRLHQSQVKDGWIDATVVSDPAILTLLFSFY
jgi:hypothetical protein